MADYGKKTLRHCFHVQTWPGIICKCGMAIAVTSLLLDKTLSFQNIMSNILHNYSEVFAHHLNVLHAVLKSFIQKNKKSSLEQRASEQVFENGDGVFNKREGKEQWLGPGKVVFQDGKVVFVQYGNVFVGVA